MSAANKKPAPAESLGRSPAAPGTAHAPAMTVPLRFILTGLAAFLAACVSLIARPEILSTYHYNPQVVAVTHLVVLGWIASVVMGAVYQLVPVALETPLYSERLARWQFLFHLAGWLGMVWMFWRWNMTQVGHFGSALAFGVALFVYNLARTLWRVPRWSVVASGVASSLGWFGITVLLGLLITAGKCAYNFEGKDAPTGMLALTLQGLQAAGGLVSRFDPLATMHTHAHAGVAGVFLLLIIGVSYRLVPMFTLSEIQNPRRAAASVWMMNAGLLGCLVTMPLRSPWKMIAAALLLAALALYGFELRAILRARKRRVLDWGVRTFLAALTILVPVAALGLGLAWPTLPLNPVTGQLENLYGFLGILGVVSLAITGMLYKIVPFLVWYRAYSPHIGLARVPSLADLYSQPVQVAGFWLYLAGLVTIAVGTVLPHGTVVRLGGALLLLAVLSLAVNVSIMLNHLRRPRISPIRTDKPLPGNTPAQASSSVFPLKLSPTT